MSADANTNAEAKTLVSLRNEAFLYRGQIDHILQIIDAESELLDMSVRRDHLDAKWHQLHIERAENNKRWLAFYATKLGEVEKEIKTRKDDASGGCGIIAKSPSLASAKSFLALARDMDRQIARVNLLRERASAKVAPDDEGSREEVRNAQLIEEKLMKAIRNGIQQNISATFSQWRDSICTRIEALTNEVRVVAKDAVRIIEKSTALDVACLDRGLRDLIKLLADEEKVMQFAVGVARKEQKRVKFRRLG